MRNLEACLDNLLTRLAKEALVMQHEKMKNATRKNVANKTVHKAFVLIACLNEASCH